MAAEGKPAVEPASSVEDSVLREPLHPVRSQNGHGVADLEEGTEQQDAAAVASAEEKSDPFEVGWDGDDDPMNPRSLPLLHKWILVIIIGVGSLCV